VLSTAYLQFGADYDYVFCVETEFHVHEVGQKLRGFFLLLPDPPSLRALLRAVRLA
jgi:chemotaxis protein CheC